MSLEGINPIKVPVPNRKVEAGKVETTHNLENITKLNPTVAEAFLLLSPLD